MGLYKVELTELAEDDLRYTSIWYENKSQGLGKKFLDKIVLALSHIQANPLAFSKIAVKSKYRKYRAPGFPYMIYYYEKDKTIYVSAVLFIGRSKKLIKRRLS
jgi:hypothetical protein